MIIIPELRTIVLLVPRAGSGSLRRAIAEKYPDSILLYRHMEADGVPTGYDRWPKLGVVRNPYDRLWSLYKFCYDFNGEQHDPAFIADVRHSVRMYGFGDWLLSNEVTFTSPYDRAGLGRFFPLYTVRHPMPENRKSQFMYLRPDLGTAIYRFDQLHLLASRLGVELDCHNRTASHPMPEISDMAREYVERVCAWDLEQSTS